MAFRRLTLRAYLTFVLVIASGISFAETRRKREKSVLDFVDCGSKDRIIYFQQVDVSPLPVIIPGTLYVTMSGNLTSDLPRRVNVYLKMKKYIFGIPFPVPCLTTGAGSCSYENICATLEQFENKGCPKALRDHGFPCHCPFLAGDFSVSDVPVNIPKIQGFASTWLNGDYELDLRINEEDGEELGCLFIKFSLKKKHRGWLFKT